MIFSSTRRPVKFIAALATALGISNSAIAADVAMPTKAPLIHPPAVEAWTFSFTPYFWATALNGSTTVKGITTDIDASFFDILEHTQFPKSLFQLAAFGEARYGRFGLLMDVAYMKLGIGADATKSRGVDALNGTVGVSAGLTIEMVIAELAAAYELAHWSGLSSPGSTTALDVYAGGRAWWQRAEAEVAISGTLNVFGLTFTRDGTLSASDSVSWIDPVVGARIRHKFTPAWTLAVSGDVGGFGAGSKFSWQALAELNYEFLKTRTVSWSGMIGYKALSVDYSQGSGRTLYEYDMTMHGPVFGITARF